MIKNAPLALKLTLFISGSVCIIFLVVIVVNYVYSDEVIRKGIHNSIENTAWRTVNRIETALVSARKTPQNLAIFLEEESPDKDRIVGYLDAVFKNNDEFYGIGIAFEPYAIDPRTKYFAPYYAKKKYGLTLSFLGDDSDRYFYSDWYQIPKELERGVWSEPYFHDTMMVTYSTPFYRRTDEGRRLNGIVTADIAIEKLTDFVNSVKILKTGYAFLISKNGTIITHPVKDFIMNETIFTIAASRGGMSRATLGDGWCAEKQGLFHIFQWPPIGRAGCIMRQ